MTARVAIGIPAWQAADFIGETLASLLAQTYVQWTATISVDGADAATVEACAPFMQDPRLRLVVQQSRLGWVGNCNAVLAAADGDYAMILPHDDLLAPTYLETLVRHAQAHPEAACVYCDITATSVRVAPQPSICGPAVSRQLALLTGHMSAVAFRGLVRGTALAAVGGLPGNEADDFGVDAVWMARLARVGELQRVAGALYTKRYHAGNTHGAWARWEVPRQRSAWIVHCRQMLHEALASADSPVAERVLLTAAVGRVTGALPVDAPFLWLTTLDQAARVSLVADFVAAVAVAPGLPADTSARLLLAAWQVVGPIEGIPNLNDRAAMEELTATNSRLVSETATCHAALQRAEGERERLATTVALVHASSSWRATAPLRALAVWLRGRAAARVGNWPGLSRPGCR